MARSCASSEKYSVILARPVLKYCRPRLNVAPGAINCTSFRVNFTMEGTAAGDNLLTDIRPPGRTRIHPLTHGSAKLPRIIAGYVAYLVYQRRKISSQGGRGEFVDKVLTRERGLRPTDGAPEAEWDVGDHLLVLVALVGHEVGQAGEAFGGGAVVKPRGDLMVLDPAGEPQDDRALVIFNRIVIRRTHLHDADRFQRPPRGGSFQTSLNHQL